jgi:ATP-dependent RNA helicase SUPV3L1/SUV3
VKRVPRPAVVATAETAAVETPAIESAAPEAPAETAVESVETIAADAPAPDAPMAEADSAEAVAPVSLAAGDAAPVEPALSEAAPAEAVAEAEPVVPAEPATPAEPEFDEIWSPAGKRSEGRRHEHRRRPDGEGQPGRQRHQRPSGPRRPEGEVQDFSKAQHLNPRAKFDAKPRNDKRRPADQKGERAKFERPVEPRREKAFDPDSPFAKLAALRDRKVE